MLWYCEATEWIDLACAFHDEVDHAALLLQNKPNTPFFLRFAPFFVFRTTIGSLE